MKSQFLVAYSDNLLMIGSTLPPNYNIYGLGEHKTSLRLKYVVLWHTIAISCILSS